MSSTKHLLDPELRAMADGPFLHNLNDAKVARIRQTMVDQLPALADPQPQGLYRKEIFAPQADGPAVRCLLYGSAEHENEDRKRRKGSGNARLTASAQRGSS